MSSNANTVAPPLTHAELSLLKCLCGASEFDQEKSPDLSFDVSVWGPAWGPTTQCSKCELNLGREEWRALLKLQRRSALVDRMVACLNDASDALQHSEPTITYAGPDPQEIVDLADRLCTEAIDEVEAVPA